jgi:hypothetical protein
MHNRTALLTALIMIVLGFLFVLALNTSAASVQRPRYTITNGAVSLYFFNFEALPFEILRPMCWNGATGWCDDILTQQRGRELWIVTDWHEQRQGAIYGVRGECYWWMYQPEVGQDGHPHIMEHFWIECPVLER